MKTEIFFGLDENETRMFSSLFRLKNELGIALSAIERWKPDMLLFDGSLVPLPGDTPRKQSNCYPLYEEVILLFQKLYLSDCLVAGVIKDAKSKRLVKILGLDGMSDSQLCLFLLKQGERTAAHKYSDEETPCLRDIGKSASFYYIRPSEDDLPLRIEVPSESDAEKTAAVLLSLCSVSREYAYPAVLVEADMVAAFSQQEALLLKEDLLSLSRGSLLQLRRNNRPFR
jgi:hypothetical protein